MKKLFKLFKINRCEQCGRKYLQLLGINQYCSNSCSNFAHEEFDNEEYF